MINAVQIITEITKSCDVLEKSIKKTRTILKEKTGVPRYIFDRLNTYEEITKKQRKLINELYHKTSENNLIEVTRLVNIINSLANMVAEDSKSIISEIKP